MGDPIPGARSSPAEAQFSLRVVGLMSGTSHDGVDAAACELRLAGDTLRLTPLGHLSAAYPTALRSELARRGVDPVMGRAGHQADHPQ